LRRVVPQQWPVNFLAKELLNNQDVKLCINCYYLIKGKGYIYCDANQINIDDIDPSCSICENWSFDVRSW